MNILMTGSGGIIGGVLKAGLNANITDYDLPKQDILNFAQLRHAMDGHDGVVHLAWGKKHDDWLTERFDPDNLQGAYNVYEAAQLAGAKRVIIASSVHADDFVNPNKPTPLDPYSLPTPDSPYGAGKCMIESLGRYYASAKNLEVICIRFGGVNKNDAPPDSPQSEKQVWLSQEDCVALVQACLDAPSVPNNFAIIYGVSNLSEELHDTTNQFGWQSKTTTANQD